MKIPGKKEPMTTKTIVKLKASRSINLKSPKPDMTSGIQEEEEEEAYLFWYKLNTPLA